MKLLLAAAALAACCALPLAAQARVRPLPASGELIRVSPPGDSAWTGTVTALGGDTLVLRTASGEVRLVVASAQPVAIHRSRREQWSGWGALAGGLAGLALSELVGGSPHSPHGISRVLVGSAAGAVVGGVAGFSAAPRGWQPLRVTQAPVAPAPHGP